MVYYGLVRESPLQIVYYLLVRLVQLLIVYYWIVRLTSSVSVVVTWTACREYELYVTVCVCMCACMITSLYCFKITASIQQYESILTPKWYFHATHFPNYWLTNLDKEISVYKIIYQLDAIEYLFVFFQLDMFWAYTPLQEQWMLQFLYICSIWCPWCS